MRVVLSGLLRTVFKLTKFWFHYTLVAIAWIGVVPLTACRTYRTLFTGSVSSIFSLPVTVFSSENILSDILVGTAVVSLTLLTFIGLVWLREQILHGGGPAWLEPEVRVAEPAGAQAPVPAPVQPHPTAAPGGAFPDLPVHGPAAGADIAAPVLDGQQGVDNPQANPDDEGSGVEPRELPVEPQELPVEPAAPEILEGVVGGGVGEGDDQQWNGMEWDRAADELTWERLLGLDGSLVFLEHVFWAVSLNALFILLFGFCPYHIGHYTLSGFKVNQLIKGYNFEGLLITMVGYCMIGVCLILFHTVTCFLGFRKISRGLGLGYLVVKVALLLVAEILVFPVICGCWLDICSLSLFDASLKDRLNSFHNTPAVSVFIHWLNGMIYIFYFASFVILLREILRPGVLWFLRNLNDPDFNPIQEMIHLPLFRHIRRFCASFIMFGTIIFVMLYCPSRIIKSIMPTFLPYTTQVHDGVVDEIAMELVLLLLVVPALQDTDHIREWLRWTVRQWCCVIAWILDLRSYLLGDVPIEDQADDHVDGEEGGAPVQPLQPRPAIPDPQDNDGGLGAVHQALLIRDGPTGYQPYLKPNYFGLRIVGLLVLMLASWLLISLILIVIPIWVGRQIFSLWVEDGHKVYELYTSAVGFYVCLLIIRGLTFCTNIIRQGWSTFGARVKEFGVMAAKAFIAFSLLVGLIPFLFGLLLDLVILIPMKVPLHQSPLYFLWQDWFLGLMYTKITAAITFMGPDWWLKTGIEQLYQDGVRNLNLPRIIQSIVMPCVTRLGLSLSVPYILSHGILPMLLQDVQLVIIVQRGIYLFTLLIVVIVFSIIYGLKQFNKLVEHIRNDRYLVGKRLVNYNHKPRKASTST